MWDGRRYYSFDSYCKERFGQKIYKLSLNGGMTCPNRDGTLSFGGCIFCSAGGSGDFAASSHLPIKEQIDTAKLLVSNKIKNGSYISYFQAYTNTYGDPAYLNRIFTEAIKPEDIAGLSIATRPDCLSPAILSLLRELNNKKPVFIELGLQTIHESTASLIRRGYPLSVFNKAVTDLNEAGINIIVHIILGLPYETAEDIFQTIDYICHLPIHGIKLQLLHILKDTDLETFYYSALPDLSAFTLLQEDAYIDCLIRCLERIPPHIIVHRITGDGPKKLLIAPLWSADKKRLLNRIYHELSVRNTYQGKETQQCSPKPECYIN